MSLHSIKHFSLLQEAKRSYRRARKYVSKANANKPTVRHAPIFFVTVCIALSSTGCISRAAHQRALDDLDAATRQGKLFAQEISGLKAEQGSSAAGLEQCKAQSEAFKSELSTAQGQVLSLQSELAQMRQAMEQAMQGGSSGNQVRAKAWSDLQAQLAPLTKAGDVELRSERGLMALVMPEAALFEPEKAELKPEGKKQLGEVAKALGAYASRLIQVEGHTDNSVLKPGGKFSDLRALSQARALEVAKALEAAGIPARSLSVAGWGESAPVGPNDTPESRAKNRRVSLVFVPTAEELPPLDTPASPAK